MKSWPQRLIQESFEVSKRRIKEEDFRNVADTKSADQLLERLKIPASESLPKNRRDESLEELHDQEEPLLIRRQSLMTVTLNTRIPQELSARIDDYIYFNKKRGTTETKQSLAIKAISAFLDEAAC